MYRLAVKRDFVSHHFLTVPDPGPEGDIHSHHFEVEVRFRGTDLDEFGYLVDIDAVNTILDDIVDRYEDTLLNDLPEFEDRNPSVEHFAREFSNRVADRTPTETPTGLAVRVWEDESAWASHERSL